MGSKNTLLRKDFTIRCRGKLIALSQPLVMGIINITDDSFNANSRSRSLQHIVTRAGEMLEAGAHGFVEKTAGLFEFKKGLETDATGGT